MESQFRQAGSFLHARSIIDGGQAADLPPCWIAPTEALPDVPHCGIVFPIYGRGGESQESRGVLVPGCFYKPFSYSNLRSERRQDASRLKGVWQNACDKVKDQRLIARLTAV